MTRTRKIVLSIAGTLLVLVMVVYCHDLWAGWHYKQYGGYEAAGIEPIPGAELVSFKYEAPGFIPDYDATWIYKIPSSYTDKLYKDCSAMRYEAGAFKEYGNDGKELIGPKKPGCHNRVDSHREVITVEFSGDQLIVQDIYGL